MSSPSSQLLATHANCLPVGTRVADFEIIGLIGEGGFGIVYLARDTSLDRVVALKEFMPAAFAGRIDGVRVAVRAANHQATFDAGLRSFINEAKLLARFAHPALVEVFRFWEGNGTAYTAMRLYQGETLRQALGRGDDDFTEERIAQIMGPIFDALEMLHREQVFHRDIAPDNIMLSDGRSVLLDFGSARKIIGDATQALTTVLKPGYAPVEQYSDDGSMKQGAWTDVYALGGVLYHLATGKPPVQSVSRILTDPLQSINQVTGDKFSATFSQAVARAMSVHVDNRFQTVTAFREALGWNVGLQPRVVTLPNPPVWRDPENAPAGAAPAAATTEVPRVQGETSGAARPALTARRTPLFVGAAVLALLLAVAIIALTRKSAGPSAPVLAPPPAHASTDSPASGPSVSAPTSPSATPGAVAEAPLAVANATATVKFVIKPRGRIDVDGIARGLSPPMTELSLPAGKHTIDIINPADPSRRVTRVVELTAESPVTVSHSF